MENCYIARLQNNKLFCFYYEEQKGILYRSYENNKWGKENILLKDTRSHFTITLDKNGAIYLFCQDYNGNIVLCTNGAGEWSSKAILKNQSAKIHTISMNPIITDDGLSIIYNIPESEDKSNAIVFQKMDENGQWLPASRIDKFVPLGNQLYTVQHITNDHILLFYQTHAPENNIGYREITPKAQSNFNIFHTTSYQVADTSFLTTENAIHVVYIIKSMFSCQLIYRRKPSEHFRNPVIIWEAQKLDNCLVFYVKNNLYITFTNNGQLYYCISEDRGVTFSKPYRYKNKFCLHPQKAIYLSYGKQAENQFYCRQIYVDSSSIWDIQLLPDLYEDFYPNTVQAEVKDQVRSQTLPALEETLESNEKLFILQNQFMLSEKQNKEKDEQIMQMTNLLKNKNNELFELEKERKRLVQKYIELEKSHADLQSHFATLSMKQEKLEESQKEQARHTDEADEMKEMKEINADSSNHDPGDVSNPETSHSHIENMF